MTVAQELSCFEDKHSKYFYYKLTFFLAMGLTSLIFLPFVIQDGGYFFYYGDYNVQQIPFYRHSVELIRNGGYFGWDWITDLGANFMGDYSFYLSTSPFFFLMCLFPSSWTPFLMVPMYTVKFAVAALCAFMYLKRFVKKPMLAVIGAFLYAFSGFQIYNVFFNHFHDAVAFFPLMLLGIEELIQNNRRGLFAFATFLCASVNYFFFVGDAVFCVLYFFFRCSSLSFKISLKKFLWLFFEAVVGVLLSCVFLLPAILAIIQNNRLNRSFSSLKSALVYLKSGQVYKERYGHILQSLFFPPDIPSRVNFFYGHETRWASNAAWIPLFGLSGVFTYFRNRRKTWLTSFILMLFVFALVPVLNSLFVATNTSYYARWMYMLVLMMALATIISLDNNRFKWGFGLGMNALGCALICVGVALRWVKNEDGNGFTLGSEPFPDRLWISVFIAFACIITTYLVVRYMRGKKNYTAMLLSALCVVIGVYGIVHIFTGRLHSGSRTALESRAAEGEIIIEDGRVKDIYEETGASTGEADGEGDEGGESLKNAPLDDYREQFYRIDFYRTDKISTTDNLGIYWGVPSIQCFNSVVPTSILDFYPQVNVTRNVASRPESKVYGLRPFLSVKYSYIDTKKTDKFDAVGFDTLVSQQEGYDVYENSYYIPMGYTYNEFMKESEFEKISKSLRHIFLCKYLVVPDDRAEYYAQFLTEVTNEDRVRANEDSFRAACEERLAGEICDSFVWDSDGFRADIKCKENNIVFFSTSYDEGWSAKVNGKEAEVLKVFYGLMAVEVPAGESTIVFEYTVPGLHLGLVVSLIALAILLVYLWYFKKVKKQGASYAFFSDSYYDSMVSDKVPAKKQSVLGALFSKEEDVEPESQCPVTEEEASSEQNGENG
ncbi:MAG: YfhO family protein [Clostridia bacterium]|nr:YfhO family protein [Clostridia bacterium]